MTGFKVIGDDSSNLKIISEDDANVALKKADLSEPDDLPGAHAILVSDELIRGLPLGMSEGKRDTPAVIEAGRHLGCADLVERLQQLLSQVELCHCLPRFWIEDDTTLRRLDPPKVLECRLEPPPPRSPDPFILKVEVPPKSEILVINTSQIVESDGKAEFVVVGTVKNEGDTTATMQIPDTRPGMPLTNDCVVVFARQYTHQLDKKGHNIVGPWSPGTEAYVQPPRDKSGNIVRGYQEDMRAPYVRRDHIRMFAEGCLSQPGKRVFYSDATRTIARDTTVNVYANVSKKAGAEDWRLIGTTTTRPNGTFVCECDDSLIGGVEGFKMELIQPGQKVEFDPIRHRGFDTDVRKLGFSLIDELFNRLPQSISIIVGCPSFGAAGARFTFESGEGLDSGQCVKMVNRSRPDVGEQIFDAGPGGVANVDLLGAKEGDELEAFVQQIVDGRAVWVSHGCWNLHRDPMKAKVELLAFDIGPEAGLKPGQKVRVTDRTTGQEHTFTARHCGGGHGVVRVALPNVSRGDQLKLQYEEVKGNKRVWADVFEWQLDANLTRLHPRETSFTSTVYNDPELNPDVALKCMLRLAEYFSIGDGKDVPPSMRKAYMFGGSIAQVVGCDIPVDKWGLSAENPEVVKWFKAGYEASRKAIELEKQSHVVYGGTEEAHEDARKQREAAQATSSVFSEMFRTADFEVLEITGGKPYTKWASEPIRGGSSVYNINGISGYKDVQVSLRGPKKFVLKANEYGLKSGVVREWEGRDHEI